MPLSWTMGKLVATCLMALSLTALTSSTEASPFLAALVPVRRGKTMRRWRYSWRRSTLALRDSSDRFWRRGSTEIPMVGASLRGMPAAWKPSQLPRIFLQFQVPIHTFSSAREKPRPARTRRLYLAVGQRTTGLSLSTGRGATEAALAWRALRLLFFLPAYRRGIREKSVRSAPLLSAG